MLIFGGRGLKNPSWEFYEIKDEMSLEIDQQARDVTSVLIFFVTLIVKKLKSSTNDDKN